MTEHDTPNLNPEHKLGGPENPLLSSLRVERASISELQAERTLAYLIKDHGDFYAETSVLHRVGTSGLAYDCGRLSSQDMLAFDALGVDVVVVLQAAKERQLNDDETIQVISLPAHQLTLNKYSDG